MKRILVGVDGSEGAAKAVDKAIELARAFDARLTIAAILEPIVGMTDTFVLEPVGLPEGALAAAQEHLDEGTRRAAAAGLTAETTIGMGAAGDALVALAKERGEELVVVGSRGRGAIARAVLGSVSDRVAHTATVPVLIVR